MGRVTTVMLFVTLVAPVYGQGADFQQMLSGKEIPLSLKLQDLNGDWRRLTIGRDEAAKGGMGEALGQLAQLGAIGAGGKNKGKEDAAGAMLGMSLLSGLFGGGGGEGKDPVYYTRGQTMTLGGETFLVAYRYRKPETSFLQMAMQAEKGGKEPDFSKLAGNGKLIPDSVLTISLVNVKTIRSLDDIRPFDLNREIAESAAGGNDLMKLIMEQAAKESDEPKPQPAARTPTPRKPAPKPKSRL